MPEFNKEIEIKLYLKKFPEKLKNLDFDESSEVDEYFMNESIAEGGKLYLRIRTRGNKRVLELKEIIQHGNPYKAEEILFQLAEENYEALKHILGKVLPIKTVIKKIRKKIKFNECEIAIDDVENLGKFMEIEGSEEKIKETCKILDIDMKDVETEGGYVQMMLKKLGLPHRNFT